VCNHDVLPLIASHLNERELVRLSFANRTVHRVAETLCIPAFYETEISRWRKLRSENLKRRNRWDQTREKLSTDEKRAMDKEVVASIVDLTTKQLTSEKQAVEIITLVHAGASKFRILLVIQLLFN
jgi:transposase